VAAEGAALEGVVSSKIRSFTCINTHNFPFHMSCEYKHGEHVELVYTPRILSCMDTFDL